MSESETDIHSGNWVQSQVEAERICKPAIFDGPSSNQIDQLAKALSAAQSEMKPAYKDSRNPRFASEYASLAQVIEASADALGKHGLSILPKISWSGDKLSMRSLLLHSSGQWIDCGTLESLVVVPPPAQGKSESRINALQAAGNNITYLLRYSNGAICRLQIQKDTDGNGPENHGSEHEYIPPEQEQPKSQGDPDKLLPTNRTRMWALNQLQAAPGQSRRIAFTEFARAYGWLGPKDEPEAWLVDSLPATRSAVALLPAAIDKWIAERDAALTKGGGGK